MDDILPTSFQISQNYPNPFNEKTTIKYCIPRKSRIKLTVYNSDVKVIKELVSAVQEAGTYEVDFFAKGLPIGKYYYEFEAGNDRMNSTEKQVRGGFTDSKEMLLIE